LISFHFNHLIESIYQQKIRSKFFSKILIKIEEVFGIRFFSGAAKKIIVRSLLALKDYKFIYSSKGKKLTLEQLLTTPEMVGQNCFVFSNKTWEPFD